MRYQDWIESLGWGGQTSVSLMLNVSVKTVHNWFTFHRSPKPEMRNKIRQLSNNQVDFALFDKEFVEHKNA